MWVVVFLATFFIGLDIGLGVGVLFNLLVVILRTILPFSPELGEARAWHYPPEQTLTDEDFDEEDLKVGLEGRRGRERVGSERRRGKRGRRGRGHGEEDLILRV